MKPLDDIYCGIDHDIPTIEECKRALDKNRNGYSWFKNRLQYGNPEKRCELDIHYTFEETLEPDEDVQQLREELRDEI